MRNLNGSRKLEYVNEKRKQKKKETFLNVHISTKISHYPKNKCHYLKKVKSFKVLKLIFEMYMEDFLFYRHQYGGYCL